MANHDYIISEVQFFRDKEDQNTFAFVEGTGIDLQETCRSKMPTIIEIIEANRDFGLEVEEFFNENSFEIVGKNEQKIEFRLIFDDIKSPENEISMFGVGLGSDYYLLIDFIKYLGKTHGKFLLYNDSGVMSLITPDKELTLIAKEFGILDS